MTRSERDRLIAGTTKSLLAKASAHHTPLTEEMALENAKRIVDQHIHEYGITLED